MLSATLNKRIEIWKHTLSENEVGTPVETYSHIKTVWGSIRKKSGNTTYDDGSIPTAFKEIIIRYDKDVRYDCRLKYDNYTYIIDDIEEIGRREGLRLQCVVWNEDK